MRVVWPGLSLSRVSGLIGDTLLQDDCIPGLFCSMYQIGLVAPFLTIITLIEMLVSINHSRLQTFPCNRKPWPHCNSLDCNLRLERTFQSVDVRSMSFSRGRKVGLAEHISNFRNDSNLTFFTPKLFALVICRPCFRTSAFCIFSRSRTARRGLEFAVRTSFLTNRWS